MLLGKGAVYSTSIKQKINTKSSTEAEVVLVTDVLLRISWTGYFLEAQGYSTKVLLAQNNMSAQKMEKNGKRSCGKRSRHMNIRYFWIKDYVDHGEVDIVHCPMEFMKADTLSKPLQGALFRKFRAQQTNIPDGDKLKAE